MLISRLNGFIHRRSEQVQRIYGFDGLLVAEDVWGGFFVLESYGRCRTSEVIYFAPDTLGWERVAPDYGTFLQFCLEGDIDGFYESFLFEGFDEFAADIGHDQGIMVYPFYGRKSATLIRPIRL